MKPKNGNEKVVLKDEGKKGKAEAVKGKRATLVGKSFDSLKAGEKDMLLRAVLEHLGWLDETGVVR